MLLTSPFPSLSGLSIFIWNVGRSVPLVPGRASSGDVLVEPPDTSVNPQTYDTHVIQNIIIITNVHKNICVCLIFKPKWAVVILLLLGRVISYQ